MLFDKGPTMTHAIEKLPKLTRRTLLQVGSGAAGAVSILGLSARSAIAAKVSKAAVAYQDSPKGDQNCASCRLFTAPNACQQVEGDISPNVSTAETNCAGLRRDSVPVGLREKGREALVYCCCTASI